MFLDTIDMSIEDKILKKNQLHTVPNKRLLEGTSRRDV
jgi:hypothetical protein